MGFFAASVYFSEPTCPHSLLVLLWITCSLSAEGLINKGLHGVDQNLIDVSGFSAETPESLDS